MEHWFDLLAQPHTRRTTLKAAALAGAALVLPLRRTSSAWATTREPCYSACLHEGAIEWDNATDACQRAFGSGVGKTYVATLAAFGPGLVLGALYGARAISCKADAEAGYHQAVVECRQPQCGDRAKYPGGNAPGRVPGPPPKCVPALEIACGDICCNATGNPECCLCPKTGMYQCCAAGRNCGCCG